MCFCAGNSYKRPLLIPKRPSSLFFTKDGIQIPLGVGPGFLSTFAGASLAWWRIPLPVLHSMLFVPMFEARRGVRRDGVSHDSIDSPTRPLAVRICLLLSVITVISLVLMLSHYNSSDQQILLWRHCRPMLQYVMQISLFTSD